MFVPDDTIVAIATPPGRGAIGVVRVSGPAAVAITARLLGRAVPLRNRHATLAQVARVEETSFASGRQRRQPVDQVIATYFAGPGSYTGEDVVEISAHGTPVLLDAIVAGAVALGARPATPGEFTLRAFLNGRLDLIQVEAVADLIDATTPQQARLAFEQLDGRLTERLNGVSDTLFDLVARLEASLDFPEEGYHFVDPDGLAGTLRSMAAGIRVLLASAPAGRLLREGATGVILGRTNVGKSSIFNYLVGTERAIVSPVAGTTRDMLNEQISIDGVPLRLVDTAGLRATSDEVETEGIRRARRSADAADLTIVVLDRSRPLDAEDRSLLSPPSSRRLVIVNKIDLPAAWPLGALHTEPAPWIVDLAGVIEVSVASGEGLSSVRSALASALGVLGPAADGVTVSNIRHVAALERAAAGIERGADAAERQLSEEFVLDDLREARVALEEVSGRLYGR